MGALAHCLTPARDVVKFGPFPGRSSDHFGLGSTPKLNFNVIVTPACVADTETEVLMACGTPERGLPPLGGHVSVCAGQICAGQMFLQILVVLGITNHAEVLASGGWGMFGGGVVPHGVCSGVVLSHTMQTNEVGLLGPGFAAVDCCAVDADKLQAEFI